MSKCRFFGLLTFRQGKWTLYSITGQSVASFELLPTHSEYNLSLGDLPKGIYLYNVQIDGQVLNSGKLIVE